MIDSIYKFFSPEYWQVLTALSAIAASNWAAACYFKLIEINKILKNEANNGNKGG